MSVKGGGRGGYACSGTVISPDSISKKYWILNKHASATHDQKFKIKSFPSEDSLFLS